VSAETDAADEAAGVTEGVGEMLEEIAFGQHVN
jgi:hypothetical protein